MGLLLALIQQNSYGHDGPQFNAEIRSVKLRNDSSTVYSSTRMSEHAEETISDGVRYFTNYGYGQNDGKGDILFEWVEILSNVPTDKEEVESLARLRLISENYRIFTDQLQKYVDHINENHRTSEEDYSPVIEIELSRQNSTFENNAEIIYRFKFIIFGYGQVASILHYYDISPPWSEDYDKEREEIRVASFISGLLSSKIADVIVRLENKIENQEIASANQRESEAKLGDELNSPFFERVLVGQEQQ